MNEAGRGLQFKVNSQNRVDLSYPAIFWLLRCLHYFQQSRAYPKSCSPYASSLLGYTGRLCKEHHITCQAPYCSIRT